MSFTRLLTVGILLSGTACNQVAMRSDPNRKQAKVSEPRNAEAAPGQPSQPEKVDNGIIHPGQTENPDELPLEPVKTPVVISGATLTCMFDKSKSDEASCLVKNEKAEPISNVKQAFIVRPSQTVWQPATLRALGDVGHYAVKIPVDAQDNFGLALVYDQDHAAVDWIVRPAEGAVNLVKNGSFEEFPLPSDKGYGMFRGSEEMGWLAEMGQGNRCNETEGVIEVQNSKLLLSKSAPNGKHWIELDATCNLSSDNLVGANMRVYQDLSLEVGQYYLLRFSFARRLGDLFEEKLRVKLGDAVVFESSIKNESWSSRSVIFKAAANEQRLSFEEIGFVNLYGTLLDDVQVIPLGNESQAITP